MADGKWWERALCEGMDTNVFFPEKAHSYTQARIERICGYCPVRAECLADRLEHEFRLPSHKLYGWYGGVGPQQRKELLRVMRERRGRVA